MAKQHSGKLALDLHAIAREALKREGVINVSAIAMKMHEQYGQKGFSLKELEGQVLAAALALNATVVFHRPERAAEAENPCPYEC